MKKYLLAHDLGTSGNKATLYSTEGELVKSCVHSYEMLVSNNNWVEQRPEDFWNAVCISTKELVQDIDVNDIAAISFSGQMMGCICVDKEGKALRNALIWADMRATKEEEMIRERISEEDFYHLTGHKISPSYGGQKLMWVKNNEPEIYENTYKMLNCKDYIILKLTGKFVTEYTDASSTNLLDLNKLEWSDRLLDVMGIDREKMPTLLKSTDVAGTVTDEAAEACGLVSGIPVVCGGGSYSWFTKELCKYESLLGEQQGVSKYDLLDQEIGDSKPGANGLLFLPYLIGERSPRWNPKAKGAFIGLKMETEKKDMVRAVQEGVAFNLGVVMDVFKGKGVKIDDMIVIGGGAQSDAWLQILADVYNINIQKPNYLEEATSMGAAITAGVGVGVFENFDVIDKFLKIEETKVPNSDNQPVYSAMKPIFDEAYFALTGVFDKLSEFTK